MRRDEESLVNPPLQDLLEQIPQKYELVLAATRRAKQILRQQQINSGELQDSKFRKPLTLALMDIAQGRVDTSELMQPDVIFDDFEEEQQEFFPELENFNRDEPDAELDGLADSDDDEDEEDEEALDEDLEEDLGVEGGSEPEL
jgi:DNA-directed RNA polymerase omega subunit